MKRMICLCLMLLCVLSACAKAPATDHTLQVVATIFPAYDFAKQIGGERVSVQMLIPPGGEVHSFEPTLQDLSAIANCDVFIYNGGESDRWVESLLEQKEMTGKTVIRLMDHVDLLMTGEDHHDHDHHHHHEVHEGDEHIWTTPQNAVLLAQAIGKGLMEQDPHNATAYQLGLAAYTGKLAALEQQYEGLRQTPKTTLVVADRFPFTYLAHTYEISYVAAFSGCTSNTEASLTTLHTLASAAQENVTGVILCTEFSDRTLADTVANRVKGTTKVWHSCHNVTRQEWEEQVTYISLMEQNYRVLQEALGQ